nr:hypothetical protein Iba_chr13fCG4180 [Ipomoea batatas]
MTSTTICEVRAAAANFGFDTFRSNEETGGEKLRQQRESARNFLQQRPKANRGLWLLDLLSIEHIPQMKYSNSFESALKTIELVCQLEKSLLISRWTPTASGDVKLRQRRPVASFRYVETIVTEMLQWPYINVDPIGGTAMATRMHMDTSLASADHYWRTI